MNLKNNNFYKISINIESQILNLESYISNIKSRMSNLSFRIIFNYDTILYA